MDEQHNKQNGQPEENIGESNVARRLRMMGMTEEPETPPDEILCKPRTLSEKCSNFWYHYKWHVIITAFFGIVLAVLLSQLLAKKTPDIYLTYAGPGYIAAGDKVEEAFRSVMEDYNGDGDPVITFGTMTVLSDEQIKQKEAEAKENGTTYYYNPQSVLEARQQFSMEAFAGETVIYLVDPGLYNQLKENGGLLPIEEILGYTPDNLYDSCGVRFAETTFAKYHAEAFADLPADTVLCCRRVSTMSVFKGQKKTEKIHAEHVAFFKTLVEFTAPADWTPDIADNTAAS